MSTVQTFFKITASVSGANAVSDLNKRVREVSTSGQALNRTFASLGSALSAIGIGVAANQLAQMADQATIARERIRLSTRSTEEFSEALNGLRRASSQTGVALNDAVDVFQRISFVRDEINASVSEMVLFTSTVQKLGIVSGASTTALSAGLLQLGQGLSAGTLRAEEFNSVLENIPAVAKLIADQFGVTTGQLRQLVLKGLVDSEDVFSAILNGSKAVEDQYKTMPMTISRAFSIFLNEMTQTVGVLDQSTAATEIFSIALKGIGIVGKALGVGLIAVFETIKAAVLELANFINTTTNNLIITPLNFALGQLSRIPGVELGQVPTFQTFSPGQAFSQGSNNILNSARGIDVFGSAFPQDQASSTAQRDISKNYAELAKGLSDKDGDKAAKAYERAARAADEFIAKQREELKTLEFQAASYRMNTLELEKLKDAREFETQVAERAANLSPQAADAFRKEADAINAKRQALIELNYEQKRTFETGAFEAFNSYAEAASNAAEQARDAITNAFKGAEDALVEFTLTGKLNFRSFAQSILADLARIAIQRSITGPLASVLGGFFGGGETINWNGPRIPGFASGGDFRGGLRLVGERGPEIEATGPSRIFTAEQTRRMLGGGGTNVSVVVNMESGGTQTQSDSQQGQGIGNLIASVVKQTLINEKRPGGLLATG